MASFFQVLSAFLLLSSALTSSFASPHHSSLAESSSTDHAAATTTAAAGEPATNEILSNEDSAAPRRVIFGKFPDPICKRFGGCSEPIDPIDPVDPVLLPCKPPHQPCPWVLEDSSVDTAKPQFGETHRAAVVASATWEESP
ncbi:unnamed protein product [Closterium sp. NIES-64]|nr:unnamed protein product [Closterium sp. NIES-64]